MDGQTRTNIQVGSLVDIVLKKDQPTGALTRGHVKRILTKSPNHPHGIIANELFIRKKNKDKVHSQPAIEETNRPVYFFNCYKVMLVEGDQVGRVKTVLEAEA